MRWICILVLVSVLSACSSAKKEEDPDIQEVSPAIQTELPAEIEAMTAKPELGGHCAWHLSIKNKKVLANGDHSLTYLNKVYYFDSEEHMNEFRKNIRKNVPLAQRRWQEKL